MNSQAEIFRSFEVRRAEHEENAEEVADYEVALHLLLDHVRQLAVVVNGLAGVWPVEELQADEDGRLQAVGLKMRDKKF